MAFSTNGFVLRPARTASGNATSTGEATTGVLRDHADLPGSYDHPGTRVEISADQYRTTVIQSPLGETEEFLVWAANTSSLTLLETSDWALTVAGDSSVTIPTGTTSVTDLSLPGTREDGTTRLVVRDPGGKSLSDVRLVHIVRGDIAAVVEVGPDAVGGPTFDFDSQDADAGVVNLSAAALAALGGGVSNRRGDTILFARYIVAAARFWWTRNDAQMTRFGWNGRTNRWEPLKGTSPRDLGFVASDGEYVLAPRPTRFAVGDTLTGDPGDSDKYALVRVGLRPDSTALVPEIEVVEDYLVEETYAFGGASPDAVVGVTNGILQWNPLFVEANAGQTVWYNPEAFPRDITNTGSLGEILGSDLEPLFLSPIPGPTDRPLVRLGFRRYLTAVAVADDTALAALTVNEGEVGWSKSTGKLKFSQTDLDKADPDAAGFDIQYLGNKVYYDGISLTAQTLRTREPVQLVDNTGSAYTVDALSHMYIPRAASLPSPGTSGVLFVPDGTGKVPTAGTVGTRPNGTGLVRQITGIGDTIIFTPSGAIEDLQVVEFEADLPQFPFLIRKGRAFVAREEGTQGSRVALGHKDRARWGGEAIYFLQADVQPAVYTTTARIYSRLKGPFTFDSTETLYFAVDGATYTWNSSALGPAGSYDAATVAASIDAVILGTGSCFAEQDRVVIAAGNESTGTVEIGLGSSGAFADRDFSGAAALYMAPGWRVAPAAGLVWLPDTGASLGVYRSPQNKDRSNSTPDFKSIGQFSGEILTKDVMANPQFTINNPPLQDVAGYDENVFFVSVDGLNIKRLNNLQDVFYDFENNRFFWLGENIYRSRVDRVMGDLDLGVIGVVGETLHPAVAAGNGLYVAEAGGPLVLQTEGTDYLLPGDGRQGIATLIEVIGGLVSEGAAGSFAVSTTTFTDANATFVTDGVAAGYRLSILAGDAAGSYLVASVTSETELEVASDVPFIADAGPSNGAAYVTWQVFKGFSRDVYDPSLVADVQYTQFNHLSDEPFKIRILENIGATPVDAAAQSASRLSGPLTEGHQRGRELSIRFGLDYGNDEATLVALTKGTELGVMANGTLYVDILDPHFADETFEIRVGNTTYSFGISLSIVAAFSVPLLGDVIQVLDTTGEIKFGETTLEEYDSAIVLYDEAFSTPTTLPAGTAEYDAASGEVNLSAADMTAHGGEAAYLVQRMITEEREDVVVSPLAGTFYFNRPLVAGQLVEVEYYQADVLGQKSGSVIVEFLPVMVKQEVATRVSGTEYTVNPTGKTVAAAVEPYIWVDTYLQNFGNASEVSFSDGRLIFNDAVDAAAEVLVNYAVYEAFGGETVYNTSKIPVYRPPFYLEANATGFELEGDRSQEFQPGMLLRLGAVPLYIESVSYSAGTNSTTVNTWPTYEVELGSRAPGNDVLTLVTNLPVTPSVNGTGTSAHTGFLMDLPGVTFEPLDKGMLSGIFHGDLTTYAVPGHLMEIGGYPFLIVASTFDEAGRTTRVEFANAVLTGLSSSDNVKISVRPIYQPTPSAFLGVNPLVETEDFELVLMGRAGSLPGKTLTRTVHYQVDPQSGAISFISPTQAGLAPSEYLLFSYTKRKVLAPKMSDGAILFPRYAAKYSYVEVPSEDNGNLGTTLVATYSYRNPDSFYFRAVSLQDYMGEVAELAIQRVQAQNPSGGPTTAYFAATDNHTQGSLGIRALSRDLLDQDRAARVFIGLYNQAIVAFEQVNETITGTVIGDRDGKFRFFIGRDKTYAPPGYEDEITGDLNPRNVWSDVFMSANGSFGVTEGDLIVNPETAVRNGVLEIEGDPMDPSFLQFYMDQQIPYVANDMDDRVLAGLARPRFAAGVPYPTFHISGDFKAMWEPHRYSRLFPENALAFTTTFPGINADLAAGDPGVYSFLKVVPAPAIQKVDDSTATVGSGFTVASTFGKPIGAIANPSLGVIENLTDVDARARLPRARVWAYYPNGNADLDAALGISTTNKATIVATPLHLNEFPVDPATGFPDVARFLTNGGDLMDLGTGDAMLSTPPFQEIDTAEKVFPQVAFGRPTGRTLQVGDANTTLNTLFGSITTDPIYGGVYVGEVLAGCVITLADETGASISGDNIISVEDTTLSGSVVSLSQGDTIYVIPPGSRDASSFSDPPTVEEQEEFSKNLPSYRSGFDVWNRKRRGVFADMSFPSWNDPSFPIQQILGQKPPQPVTTIEADVDFVNNSRSPHKFPALLGEDKNDDGDYAIPYLSTTNTELDRLLEASAAMEGLVYLDTTAVPTHAWLSVYPDEIVGNDGLIVDAATVSEPPATLITGEDLHPVNGAYTANSGVGDIQRYDLLLVERDQGLDEGSTGILTVGEVDAANGYLEPPRFVSATADGLLSRYTFRNAMAHITSTGLSGMSITRAGNTTTFDISSVGGLVFNDGVGAAVAGGLNSVFAANNALIIRIYQNSGGGAPGTLVETIIVTNTVAIGGAGTQAVTVALAATDKQITLDTAAAFVTNTGTTYDFTIDIDTYINTVTHGLMGGSSPGVGNGTGTTTAFVHPDRLTFEVNYDLTTAPARGVTTAAPGSVQIAAGLQLWHVWGSGAVRTVNGPATVNNGQFLTFQPRTVGGQIGSFVAASISGAGDEEGTVKVNAWEGYGTGLGAYPNDTYTAITGTNIRFSAVPSSEAGATAIILDGTGDSPDGTNRVSNIGVGNGAIANVESGDLLIINTSAAGDAAVKAGTYLVRHAIDVTVGDTYELFNSAVAGNTNGWVQIVFPKVVSWDDVGGTITVDNADTNQWTAIGRLYVVVDPLDPTSVISMAYTALASNEFTLNTATGQDAVGGAVAAADFFAALRSRQRVSGMRYVPVNFGFHPDFPDNNVVGYQSTVSTAGGFRHITISNTQLTGLVFTNLSFETYTWGAGLTLNGGAGSVAVTVGTPINPWQFDADSKAVVYNDVATYLDLSGITSGEWDNIHTDAAGTSTSVLCVLPMDKFALTNTVGETGDDNAGAAGFLAQAGVFLEPSWPRTCRDLAGTAPRVVDARAGLPLTAAEVGMRNFGGTESVSFQVRRIRRFHEALIDIGNKLLPLRYAYEIRRGTVLTYTAAVAPLTGYVLAADTTAYGTATQVGDFNDVDVNINAGDIVRLLDASGNLVDTAEIASVGSTSLLLREPGFSVTPLPGDSFEVYLRQAPVPHEQNNEQLFDVVVEEVVYETTANYGAQTGGYVGTYNELSDNTNPTFSLVREGDYVIIDPAGAVEGPGGPASPQEYGARPTGDTSVSGRAEFSADQPNELDDNRGFYRVTEVQADRLVVTGASDFSGEVDNNVVYGAAGQEYVVLPTISNSSNANPNSISGTTEGQQDLRTTAAANGADSFKGNQFSIQPFSYRVVRPSSLFTQETVELVFFMRERMLSWMEEIGAPSRGEKTGSYFVFQRDEHMTDLGSPNDVMDGLGVLSNDAINSLTGLLDAAPFANVADCLSILDRRYWCLDYRLDYETPTGGGGYYSSFAADAPGVPGLTGGSGRPVLPDRVDEVLDRSDRLRDLRYAWIKFRTDKVTGTLPSLDRFIIELPRLLAEQEELLRLKEGLDNT